MNMGELLSRNELPATRVGEIVNDVNRVAPTELRDLTGPLGNNTAKKLRRRFLKKSTWMPDYIAEIRTWDPKTQKVVHGEKVPMQLSHEVVAVLLKHGFRDKLLAKDRMDPLTLEHLRHCESEAGCDLLGTGLWGDGAPTQWDRNETIDVLSLSLPGLEVEYRNLRIPLIVLPHSRVCSETWEDVFSIIKWSLTILATGLWPTCRHDGSAWEQSDKCRRTARPFLRGALVEVRQDWKFAAEVFGFPAHNTLEGCCWACKCTPAQVRQVDSGASWRSEPLSHADCLLRILRSRRTVNPLLTAPWVTSRIFRMDWLHVADLGVTADFIGNFLHEVLELFPGGNKKDRCANLYVEVQAYYDAEGISDRFDCLLPTFFEPKDKPYKLRGSAANIRALVPFVWQLAQEMLDISVPKHAAMSHAAFHLNEVYSALSADHPDPCATMREHGIKFAIQYVALHDHLNAADDKAWRIKPKMHLFLHITSDNSMPRLTWTYRGEDFGGSVARMSRRRGGLLKCGSTSFSCLSRFRIANPCIRIR